MGRTARVPGQLFDLADKVFLAVIANQESRRLVGDAHLAAGGESLRPVGIFPVQEIIGWCATGRDVETGTKEISPTVVAQDDVRLSAGSRPDLIPIRTNGPSKAWVKGLTVDPHVGCGL